MPASLLTINVSAQNEKKQSNLGILKDILWPFVAQATRTHFAVNIWQKGNLRGNAYVGLNINLPRDRETEGRFADYSLASVNRQYFRKGLHPEISQTTGLGVLLNHVTTGNTYNISHWLVSNYIAYKFEFAKKKINVLRKLGIARALHKNNTWPIYEVNKLTKEGGESPFILGSLKIGYITFKQAIQ